MPEGIQTEDLDPSIRKIYRGRSSQSIKTRSPDSNSVRSKLFKLKAKCRAFWPIGPAIHDLQPVLLARGSSFIGQTSKRGPLLEMGLNLAQAVSDMGLRRRALVPFLWLTPIGYFIRRNRLTGLPLTPLWVWLGCVIIFVFIEIGIDAP